MRNFLMLVFFSFMIAGCQPQTAMPGELENRALLTDPPLSMSPLYPSDLNEMVHTLSATDFRFPQSNRINDDLVPLYFRDLMWRIGLRPGNGDQWFQSLPLIKTIPLMSRAELQIDGQSILMAIGEQLIIRSSIGTPHLQLVNNPIVLMSNDFHRQPFSHNRPNLSGKTVLIFPKLSRHGTHEKNAAPQMTSHGLEPTWQDQITEAANLGAAAVLLVYDPDNAPGIEWQALRSLVMQPRYHLFVANTQDSHLLVDGWIHRQTAQRLLASANLSFAQAYQAMATHRWQSIALKATWTAQLHNMVEPTHRQNVIGVLPGQGMAHEAIVYIIPWPFNMDLNPSVVSSQSPSNFTDQAVSVAGLMKVASLLATDRPLRRSIIFVVTGDDFSEALGAKYFLLHPTFPISQISAAILVGTLSVEDQASLVVEPQDPCPSGDQSTPSAALTVAKARTKTSSHSHNAAHEFASAGIATYTVDRYATKQSHEPKTPTEQPLSAFYWEGDRIFDDLRRIAQLGAVLGNHSQSHWVADHCAKSALRLDD